MKYAVVTTGNKQYKVSEGDIIEIDQLAVNAADSYTFTKVLLYVDGNIRKIGTPTLSDTIVIGGVIENKKGKKVRVAKFKAKSRYRRVNGFRPCLTMVKIEKIEVKGEKDSLKKAKTENSEVVKK